MVDKRMNSGGKNLREIRKGRIAKLDKGVAKKKKRFRGLSLGEFENRRRKRVKRR